MTLKFEFCSDLFSLFSESCKASSTTDSLDFSPNIDLPDLIEESVPDNNPLRFHPAETSSDPTSISTCRVAFVEMRAAHWKRKENTLQKIIPHLYHF